MDKVFVKVEDMNKWVAKYFPNKDIVTVEDLLGVIEDLDSELEERKIELEELEENLHDNYKPINPNVMYGINDRDY